MIIRFVDLSCHVRPPKATQKGPFTVPVPFSPRPSHRPPPSSSLPSPARPPPPQRVRGLSSLRVRPHAVHQHARLSRNPHPCPRPPTATCSKYPTLPPRHSQQSASPPTSPKPLPRSASNPPFPSTSTTSPTRLQREKPRTQPVAPPRTEESRPARWILSTWVLVVLKFQLTLSSLLASSRHPLRLRVRSRPPLNRHRVTFRTSTRYFVSCNHIHRLLHLPEIAR